MAEPSRILPGMLEAIFGSDDRIGGQSITKLTADVSDIETLTLPVESTLRFGENVDSAGDALLLINGEIIYAASRTATSFTNLARAQSVTTRTEHKRGSLVYDFSKNRTALDHVRRGFFVRTARLEDLDVVGRNLGLHRCNGITEEQWRALIQVMAYLPNQPIDAFKKVLDVYPGIGNYTIYEELISAKLNVFVEVPITFFASAGLRGKFFLNGGTPAVADGTGTQVVMPHPINNVLGVFDDNYATRNGEREGQTDYFAGGGSFVGSTITLGTPVAPGAPLMVDYGVFTAHYIQANETVRYPEDGDFFPYLSDVAGILTCLLDQVRAAGVKINIATV